MSPQHDIFEVAIEFFASDQEDIRTAAAFAAGDTFSNAVFFLGLIVFIQVISRLATFNYSSPLLFGSSSKTTPNDCLHSMR
jgi:hypothetical protein